MIRITLLMIAASTLAACGPREDSTGSGPDTEERQDTHQESPGPSQAESRSTSGEGALVRHLDDSVWKTNYLAGQGEATVLIKNRNARLTAKSAFELLMDRQKRLSKERPVSFVSANGLVEEHPSTHPNRAFHVGFAEKVAEYAFDSSR